MVHSPIAYILAISFWISASVLSLILLALLLRLAYNVGLAVFASLKDGLRAEPIYTTFLLMMLIFTSTTLVEVCVFNVLPWAAI